VEILGSSKYDSRMDIGMVYSASEELFKGDELMLVVEEHTAESFIWFIGYG
jgi:hypothetical protein